jgi:hypothetical protein
MRTVKHISGKNFDALEAEAASFRDTFGHGPGFSKVPSTALTMTTPVWDERDHQYHSIVSVNSTI